MNYLYQNQNQDDDKQGEVDKKARRHRMQSSLLIMESDYGREGRKAEDLKSEIIQLKIKIDQINANIEDKDEELKKMDGNQEMLEENIAKLKKKLKAL